MEHIELVCSLEYELTLISTCSVRISSRNQVSLEKPLQLSSDSPVLED